MSFEDAWTVAGWSYAWWLFLTALAVLRGSQ
jgi:hypothetical protein